MDLPPGVSLKTVLWIEKINLPAPDTIKLDLFFPPPCLSVRFQFVVEVLETEKSEVKNLK